MSKLTFLLILISFVGVSQPNIDSLWDVWNDESQPDTSRLKAMQNFTRYGYLFTQPDSAFYFAQLQYEFAEEKGIKEQMAHAQNTQGISFAIRGNYTKAIDYYSRSLKIREEIGDKQGIAGSLNNIGYIYFEKGDYAKAIEYYSRALKIKEKIGDKRSIAGSLANIGNVYYSQGYHIKAIDYYSRALKIQKEIGDESGIAKSLNNIGTSYADLGEQFKAIDYFSRSLAIKEKIGDKHSMAGSLNNIGIMYKNQGDSAFIEGNTALSEVRYARAVDYYTRALKISEEIGDKRGVAMSLNNIGRVFIEYGDFDKAHNYISRSLKIAQEVGAAVETKAAAEALWSVNKKLGRHKAALEMYELFITTRDSLASEENQKEMIRQEYKYQYEKQAAVDSIENAKQQRIAQASIEREKAENERKETVQYALFGGLALVLVFAGLMFNRFRVTRKQKGVIEEQKEKVDAAFIQLDEKNQEIVDSINYAKRIQSAILPPQKLVKEYLQDSFVFYLPKDIVAGDFYWMEHTKDQLLFAAADCTGHGVPGAMVSVVCNNGLNRSVREYGLTEPAKILNKTREIVIQEFEKSEEEVKDGMDIALCALRSHSQTHTELQYAGAHNPLWIIRKGTKEIEEIKADKQPIGKFGAEKPFTNHTVELQKGDTIYIFSDGFPDQFGGERGKKFKSKNFKKLLLSITDESMEKQRELIAQTFEEWKGSIEQLDDVCILGVRI